MRIIRGIMAFVWRYRSIYQPYTRKEDDAKPRPTCTRGVHRVWMRMCIEFKLL
jgi:hypothetical protein